MDKVKKYLELYVEWLALALGVAFAGWMVYSYVLQQPVAVSVENAPTTPGEIDTRIWNSVGGPLAEATKSQTVPPMPKVQDVVALVQQDLSEKTDYALAGVETPLTPNMSSLIDVTGPEKQLAKDQVTQLPKPAAVENAMYSMGHSAVTIGSAAGAPAGNQPSQQASDRIWVTVGGTIPIEPLAQAFKDCKIPNGTGTLILNVELDRWEVMPDGSLGPMTVIPALDMNKIAPLPPELANAQTQTTYHDLAEKSQQVIDQPPFYTVAQGDLWYAPGTKNPNIVEIKLVKFDPAAFFAAHGDPATLSAEDRAIYDAWKRQQQQDKARQNANKPNTPQLPNPGNFSGGTPSGGNTSGGRSNGGGRSGGGTSGGGRRGVAADPERPDHLTGTERAGTDRPATIMPPQGLPGQFPTPAVGQLPPPPPNSGEVPPGAAPGGTDKTAASTLPAGSFVPANQGPITVWAHDDTVQAGKRYQYKLRYYILNPVARSQGLCNPQSLADKFWIPSDEMKTPVEVEVDADSNFYVSAVNVGKGTAVFDVFHWKEGNWQLQKTDPLGAGDMVGSIDPGASKTDFSTGWTVLDVMHDEHTDVTTVLLVSDNGTVLRRDLYTDQHDARHQQLSEQVRQAKEKEPKTAAANP